MRRSGRNSTIRTSPPSPARSPAPTSPMSVTSALPGAVLRFGNLPAMINADVHSGEDVILTATGPGSDRVRGQMDNTEVFRVMVEALGLGSATGTDARAAQGLPAGR